MWCSTHRRRLVHLFRSENGPRRRRTLGGLSYRVGGLSYRVGVLSAGSVTESDIGEISPYFAGRKRCSHRMAVSSHPMRSGSGGLIVLFVGPQRERLDRGSGGRAKRARSDVDPAFRVMVSQTGRSISPARNEFAGDGHRFGRSSLLFYTNYFSRLFFSLSLTSQ